MRSLIAAAALLLGACALASPTDPPPTPTPIVAAVTAAPIQSTNSPSPSPSPLPTTPNPTTPSQTPTATPTLTPTLTQEPLSVTPAPEGTPQGRECVDDTYNLLGHSWDRPLEWKFNLASVPARYDAGRALAVIKAAFANVTDVRNLCGRPDNVHATAVYSGTTNEVPCGADTLERDYSVVGFRQRPAAVSTDTIAYICTYETDAGQVVIADIVITTDVRWALSESECRRQQHILEAVMTHEVGHAFGLDHVGRRHNDLTMRRRSGPCEYGDATLGLGDMLGLEELYGSE